MAEYILTDQDFGVILKLFADATSVNIADAGGYFTGTEVETALQEIGLRSSVARPLNGFEDRTQSTLSWGGTRTLTLTPSSTDYYWLGGYRYSYSSPLTKQIDDTTGIWVFYFDAGDPTTLTAERNPSETNLDTIILDDCIVAIVYWNANSGTAVILADERHGVRMSAETHHYLHDTRGARLVSGGAISGYTLSTATDAAISFDLTDIRIYDEDLELDIADGSAANQYEQVLTGDAEIPVLYRDDTDGSWVEQAASTLPYIINGTPQPTYMNDDGDGTWSQVELSNNKFMLYFLMATNDWQYPVKMIQGQAEYATASAARTAINTEISNWSGLPTPEWCLMYAFVMQQSAGNTKELVIIEILDYRFENIVGTTSSAAIDHGNTVGLLDDDHTQYLLIDGTRAMTGTLLLNCAKNAYTSAHGIALDLSGTDDLTALQMRDSTDVAHGCTSWASTDTWGALRKAGASGGGLKLEGYTDSDGTVGIYMQSFVGGTLDATKSTAGSAAVNIICGLISGTGLAATITADCNLLAVRKVESGPVYTTVFMVDEDGDTWQPGHVGLNTVKNSYESPIGLYMDIAGNDTPCMTFRDSTDIAHGMTGYTDTSTWGDITKAVVASGGIRIRGFSETNYQAFKLLGFVGSAPDTTFSSAGRSACEIICGQMSGASVGAYGADSNVFSVRKQETGAAETTLWILDEDGDTWQSGYLNLESAGSVGIVIFAGTNQTANIVAKNDAQIWSFGCGGEDNWFVYDTSNSKYAIQVIPNPLHKILLQTTYTAIAEGATNKHYWTSGVYFLNDSANANMTAGITINQGASDDEIMSFKSSDVAHGATHAVETDSYGRIKKAESDSGGLQIDGFKDADGPTGALAIVMNGRIASNCDTTKSTAGRAIIELKSAQTSGAADANIVADGNIFGIRGYTGGGFSTKLLLDEDGDLWLAGHLTANGGTPGAYNYFGATTFINDTANTGMSLGLTIHQGANTDEILAFKNTNVGHGATDLAETDTFANFKTYEGAAGGLKISSFKDADGIPLSMGLYGYLAENANTTKSNAGYGIVNVYAAQTSGASVANVVADGNIFSVQCRKGAANATVLLLDEDGDLWLTGLVNAGTATPVADMNVFKWSTTSTIRIVGDTGTGFDLQHAQTTAAAYVWLRDNAPMYFGTNNTTAMTITAAGEVTMPLQPGFQAYKNGDSAAITSTYATIPTWTERWETGTGFNNTTGVFTAPVAGVYMFSIVLTIDNVDTASAYFAILFNHSGSYSQYFLAHTDEQGSDYSYQHYSANVIIKMAASDTLQVQIKQDAGAEQAVVKGTYSSFCGWLLG